MTKVWKRIYEANYHKSLDHRSFYFKQAEKRCVAELWLLGWDAHMGSTLLATSGRACGPCAPWVRAVERTPQLLLGGC